MIVVVTRNLKGWIGDGVNIQDPHLIKLCARIGVLLLLLGRRLCRNYSGSDHRRKSR